MGYFFAVFVEICLAICGGYCLYIGRNMEVAEAKVLNADDTKKERYKVINPTKLIQIAGEKNPEVKKKLIDELDEKDKVKVESYSARVEFKVIGMEDEKQVEILTGSQLKAGDEIKVLYDVANPDDAMKAPFNFYFCGGCACFVLIVLVYILVKVMA